MSKELHQFRQRVFEDLEQLAYNEDNWEKLFETKRTCGEITADYVSNFGGSWTFALSLFSFILIWSILNKTLPDNYQWDPYPYILLNLFLSIIAACQAPIIMMSQKRIEARDRNQRAYIDKFVLRSEKQISHVNEKIDFIIDKLFKDSDNTAADVKSHIMTATSTSFCARSSEKGSCVKTDKHLAFLLNKLGNVPCDDFIFTHWNEQGDNFYGFVSKIRIKQQACTSSKKVSYDISFSVPNVTLDDIFSGDYELRNDLDLEYMDADGKFENLQVLLSNGRWEAEIPPHYKPSFTINRLDKINDFWKQRISGIRIDYTPLRPVADEEDITAHSLI